MNSSLPYRDLRLTSRRRGFTLIELMIVVAIVAVIGAIALPAYFSQVRKSRRADAITSLNAIAQAQERWRSNNSTYSSNLTNLQISNPSSGYYTLAIDSSPAPSATTYAATATAAGAQASDSQCQTLTLTMSAGNITYGASPGTANFCWNR